MVHGEGVGQAEPNPGSLLETPGSLSGELLPLPRSGSPDHVSIIQVGRPPGGQAGRPPGGQATRWRAKINTHTDV